MSYTFVPRNHIFEIPESVAKCPYCGAKLYASCDAWTEETEDTWIADSIDVDCDNEPESYGRAWHDWLAEHSEMPYVHQLPVDCKVKNWINANYRFNARSDR